MRLHQALLAPVLLLAVACGEIPTAPTELAVDPSMARSPNAIVHRASGGGKLDLALFNLPNEQYGFTASVDGNGNAKGQLHANFSTPDVTFHADVACTNVQGNAAWIGVSVTTSSPDLIYPAGTLLVFKVVDNGDGGSAAPDQMSFFYLWGGAGCDFHAANVPTFDWANGNIQVN